MKKIANEEFVLLVSVIKWIILAAFVGVAVGASTSVFLLLLDSGINLGQSFRFSWLLLPPALMTSAFLIKRFAPAAEGHGTEKVIEAVHQDAGRMKPSVIPVKLLATVITIASGGSAGKEGPAAQIGAGVSSFFADLFKFDSSDRKKLVICGISAGFSAVFGTPVAGAVFGIEVLFIGGMLYQVLLPSFISGIVSYYITSLFGVGYFNYPVIFPMDILTIFDKWMFLFVILSGVFFGLCSLLFIETMNFAKKLSLRAQSRPCLRAFAGGAALILLTILFSDAYLGLGIGTIKTALSGGEIVWYAFLMKIVFTCITLNSGGSGGVVTPIFHRRDIGASFRRDFRA